MQRKCQNNDSCKLGRHYFGCFIKNPLPPNKPCYQIIYKNPYKISKELIILTHVYANGYII